MRNRRASLYEICQSDAERARVMFTQSRMHTYIVRASVAARPSICLYIPALHSRETKRRIMRAFTSALRADFSESIRARVRENRARAECIESAADSCASDINGCLRGATRRARARFLYLVTFCPSEH